MRPYHPISPGRSFFLRPPSWHFHYLLKFFSVVALDTWAVGKSRLPVFCADHLCLIEVHGCPKRVHCWSSVVSAIKEMTSVLVLIALYDSCNEASVGLGPICTPDRRRESMNEQRQDVFRVADEIFRQRPSWVTFFREVLGVDGIVRQVHSSPETLSQFEQTPEYQKIQQMLAKLRENDADLPGGPREPTRVITVRLPKSLHESLRAEAHDRHTSMNKLCISKLLQVVDDELVPAEAGMAEKQSA
jgi:predicted HicB family RNase H-like nuclease